MDKTLPAKLEDEIKEGFFELKQKFMSVGPSSIYISHPVLHEKHPLLKKLELNTLKLILADSQIIYLEPKQPLYKAGATDTTLYIVLFGRLQLKTLTDEVLGNQLISIGWTLGEEILFDSTM